MSVEVKIPTVLRKHTGGEPTLHATGANLRELIDDIAQRFPDFRDQVVSDDGDLHRFINVYVNDEDVRYLEALETAVSDGDTVAILPAVAGGSGGGSLAWGGSGGSGGGSLPWWGAGGSGGGSPPWWGAGGSGGGSPPW